MSVVVDYKELGEWGSGRVSKLIKMFYESDRPCTLITNEIDIFEVENIANDMGVECLNPDSKRIEVTEFNGDIVHKLVFN